MNEQLKIRVDSGLAAEAAKVCRRMGITPTSAVSMFFAQMVKVGGMPFRPSDFPALEEYGVTLREAEAAESAALAEIAADRKAGRLTKFNGRL